MLLPIHHNCRDAAKTSNKDNYSSLTSSSTTTAKAKISPLPTIILPTTTSTAATLATTDVSDLLAS